MSFFEQILYEEAGRIATLYAGKMRQRMESAASRFRIPYWDWAMTPERPWGHVLPDSVTQSEIYVDGPRGVQKIANPLFAYRFNPLVPLDFPDAPVRLNAAALACPESVSRGLVQHVPD